MSCIVILTGHPASGKTSLTKNSLFTDWIKIDIAELIKEFNSDMPHVNDLNIYIKLRCLVFNNLFRGRKVIVELIGNERFFSHFRDLCWKSSYKLVEIELCKVDLKTAAYSMQQRDDHLIDIQALRTMHGVRFNTNATLFLTTIDRVLDFDRLTSLITGEVI